MKISRGLTEDGVIVGNNYDKYGSSNPIVRYLMRGFASALTELAERVQPASIHEVGCGEGFWTLKWRELGIAAVGSDFSGKIVALAQSNAEARNVSPDIFRVRSIYDLDPECDSAELVVCCEVLEHLQDPIAGLLALRSVANPYLIVSVPREPIWRVLNMTRGKYWKSLGNTPGHVQWWSQHGFVSLVSRYFRVMAVRAPFPWTMLLCKRIDERGAG